MIQIIISIDPSTHFLYEIIEKLKANSVQYNLTEVYPTFESYASSINAIAEFKKGSNVLFLGHGRDDKLYGGENLPDFEKKTFVNREQMKIFEDQFLFLLACQSSGLLKSTFRFSKFRKSIGFGGLPTSKEEVEDDRKLSSEGISQKTIEKFKTAIVEIVSKALLSYIGKGNNDFIYLKDLMTLLIDKEINSAILEKDDRNLGDLLFKMRNEMSIY